jgi:hypothetical protein
LTALVGMFALASALLTNAAVAGGSKPTIQFKSGSASVAETTTSALIPVSLSAKGTASAHFRTAGGTANPGTSCGGATVDYVPVTDQPVSFTSPTTQVNVSVTICHNAGHEPNETVVLQLFGPITGASFGSKQEIKLTITDNDATAVVAISGAPSVNEGASADFTISVTGASPLPISVTASTANSTATAPSDFPATSTPFSWPPGDTTTRTFTVPTNHNTIHEATETFTANLSSLVNASYGTTTATGTILDTDTAPSVSIADSSGTEGGNVVFTITQSAVSGTATTVRWDTADASATSPGDYTAVVNGLATIAAGSTTTTATVNTFGDNVPEATETFGVTLSAPVNATLGTASATGTINDDDVSISIANSSATEAGDVVFTITQSGISATNSTVQWDTADGTATAPDDYGAVVGGIATITAGLTSTTVTVNTTGDSVAGPHEAFSVNLSNASGATIATGTATGTINDDDVDETEPNNTSATASPLAAGPVTYGQDTGNDQDFYKVTVLPGQWLDVLTVDGGSSSCSITNQEDTVITVYGPDGTAVVDENDDIVFGVEQCSHVNTGPLAGGTYFIRVWDWSSWNGGSGASFSYGLQVGLTVESEPNNSFGTADAIEHASETIYGAIAPDGEQDFYAVTVTAGQTINAQTVDGASNQCTSGFFDEDTVITVYDTDGTTVLFENDDSVGSCSQVTTGPLAVGGTYYVRVWDWSDWNGTPGADARSFTYGLQLSVT